MIGPLIDLGLIDPGRDSLHERNDGSSVQQKFFVPPGRSRALTSSMGWKLAGRFFQHRVPRHANAHHTARGACRVRKTPPQIVEVRSDTARRSFSAAARIASRRTRASACDAANSNSEEIT
jgi:hypothetical protein